jgi:pyridoxal phosphate enzyme (YggS family)
VIYELNFAAYDVGVSLADNLNSIQQRIQSACDRAGRDAASVTLLAVSKTHPAETVSEAVKLGLFHFGENKVQEAKSKIPNCPGRAHWHFIGHLQSNKCRDAVELFEMIQSVDSLSLAEEISKRAIQSGKTMRVLLEINVAGESSKFGYPPARMLEEISAINALARIEIHGLMAVPPFTPVAERSRGYFRELRALKESAEQKLGAPLSQLSMGMSGDFEVAIEEGATIVRLGTALFGERNYAKTASQT